MYRPPYGKITLPTYISLRRRGAPVWWWTIDSGDTWGELPHNERAAAIVQREGGGIVLLHDTERESQRDEFVLKTTESLVRHAALNSIKMVTVGEIVSE